MQVKQLFFRGGIAAGATLSTAKIVQRHLDTIQGTDSFSRHTTAQHQSHLISEMHAPFIDPTELDLFKQHFRAHSHLLPTSLDRFRRQQALKTPVQIKPLSACPVSISTENAGTALIGGAPALISGVSYLNEKTPLTYLNDNRRWPIAYGSAWHLEQDADAEAPTTAKPSRFLVDQFKRATIAPVYYASIEESGGLFPWKTLDWIGWIKHPEAWLAGIKLAYAFELITRSSTSERQVKVQRIAAQCKINEQYYDRLNAALDGKLLLPGQGSIIVARNEEEVSELKAMQQSLAKEGRELVFLTRDEMLSRFNHAPEGLLFAEKPHDRSLSPHFMSILTQYIRRKGGEVKDGTLTTVYADPTKEGGIAEYRTPDGKMQYLPFSRLVMSLGSQEVVDEHNQPLFDTVAARGVSILAHVKVPKRERLPALIVCGGTNHVTTIDKKAQADHDLYLVRMTAGACITPNVSTEDSVNYDGTIALGLVTSVRKTLGYEVTPVAVYGCNRQVSQYGQTSWITPSPGVHIQYGAGGGGLTRAPDLVATAETDESCNTMTKGMAR